MTARRAAADPAGDIETTMGRIGHLLAEIEIGSQLLDGSLRPRGSSRRRRRAA